MGDVMTLNCFAVVTQRPYNASNLPPGQLEPGIFEALPMSSPLDRVSQEGALLATKLYLPARAPVWSCAHAWSSGWTRRSAPSVS